MGLSAGTRFGEYEILGPLGEGGMGEVYRARDTELERDVAIKVLPESFATDESRVARFEQEARTLAALNHANIAQVFGIERAEGQTAIVMELVPGSTLADRLQQGPLAPDDAVDIALQIANALEAAHERGIVHRDLKPANIKLKPDGTVTVLDFGIAKAVDFATLTSGPRSPVMTTPVTQTGTILGTAAYMSPEQARGKPVDKRTDIWAFGCVLYEMLTGQPAFGGEDVPLTLAKVLAHDTDMQSLPAMISPAVLQTLRVCLQKELKKRVADIRDVRLVLQGGFESGAAEVVQPQAAPLWRRILPLAATVLITAAVVFVIANRFGAPVANESESRLRAFIITQAQGPHDVLSSNFTSGHDLVFAPDSNELIYVGESGGLASLFRRQLTSFEATEIAGTAAAIDPFFSPDGQWLGFLQGSKLKRMQYPQGRPIDIVESGTSVAGMTWGSDDTIVFSRRGLGLFRVAAAGGAEEQRLTTPNPAAGETEHNWPTFLPNGRDVVFTVLHGPNLSDARLALLSLDTGEWELLLNEEGYDAKYVPSSGHLVYGRAGIVMAVAFDPVSRSVQGQPFQIIVDPVTTRLAGAQLLALAPDGSLAYIPDTNLIDRELVWFGRNGAEESVGAPLRPYTEVRLSPNGRQISALVDGTVIVYDLQRRQQLVGRNSGASNAAAWNGDGTQLALVEGNQLNLLTLATLDIETVFEPQNAMLVTDWSAANDTIMMQALTGESGWDLVAWSRDSRSLDPYLTAANSEMAASFSPDGRYVVYTTTEADQVEVFVSPFPRMGSSRFKISLDGGDEPLWSRTGDEIFYRNGDYLMAVEVSVDPEFSPGATTELFARSSYSGGTYTVRDYDYDPVSDRFLMTTAMGSSIDKQINVVLNWAQVLNEKAP